MLGVLEGSFGRAKTIFDEFPQEGETMISDLEHAILDIEHQSPERVQDGIELIGQAIEDSFMDVKKCRKPVKMKVKELVVAAGMLSQPWSFRYDENKNIFVNQLKITDKIQAAVLAWESNPEDYYQFGFKIGEVLNQLVSQDDELDIETLSQ